MTLFPENYKFIGLEIYISNIKIETTRETYDVLTWLGDVGGF